MSQPAAINPDLELNPDAPPKKTRFVKQVFDVQMIDGTEYLDIRVTHSDRIAGEVTAQKHKWADARPLTSVSFWIWHALRREGRIPLSVTFEKWTSDVAEMEKQDEEEPVDPTQSDPGSD